MRVKVLSEQVFQRNITSKAGKPYNFREQEAVVEIGLERRIIVLGLEDGQAAYPKGEYDVTDASFDVDRNRNLVTKPFAKLVLKPVVGAVQAARVAG